MVLERQRTALTRDVLLLQKPTAVPNSTLMDFSLGYRSGWDVIRVEENNHIRLDLAQLQTRKALQDHYPHTVWFFCCLRHVVMRRNAYVFVTFEADWKPCLRRQKRIVIS